MVERLFRLCPRYYYHAQKCINMIEYWRSQLEDTQRKSLTASFIKKALGKLLLGQQIARLRAAG